MTLVLIIVVIVFSVCQAPALLNQILWNVLDDPARNCGGFQFYYSRVSNMLVVTNSAVNFPIYAVFNTRFRQVLTTQVMPCLGGRRSGVTGGGVSSRTAAAAVAMPGYSTVRRSQLSGRTGYAAMVVEEDPATTYNRTQTAPAANGLMPQPPPPVITSQL